MGNNFKIEISKTNRKSNELSSESKELKRIADEIIRCRNQLRMSGRGSAEVKRRLGQLHDQAMDIAVHMDSFSEALSQIVRLYTDCENRICGNGKQVQEGNNKLGEGIDLDSPGTDKRGWLKKLWDKLWGKEVDPRYTATSQAQERAADEEFRRQIDQLTKSDRYTEETWKNSTPEERKQILEDYMNEVAGVLGVDVKGQINFTNTPPSGGTVNMGSYRHSSKSVQINEYIINSRDPEDSYHLMTTVVHELRHAYQHSAVDHPEKYQVSKETIDSWKQSFKTYGQEKAKGYEAYRNIVVEKDARKFAGQE